jgi:signal transduction histidine kinase
MGVNSQVRISCRGAGKTQYADGTQNDATHIKDERLRMHTTQKRHENLVTLCQSVSLPADVIAQQCQALFETPDSAFNAEQTNDIDIMSKNAQQLAAKVAAVNAANEAETYQRMSAEEFTHFSYTLLHDLRSSAGLISGFSEISLLGITGKLTDEQKAIMKHIHQLSLIMLAAFADYQAASERLNQ